MVCADVAMSDDSFEIHMGVVANGHRFNTPESTTLPYGWAGEFVTHNSMEDVEEWCSQHIERSKQNVMFYWLGTNVTLIIVRKPTDYTLCKLRWA